MIDVSLETLCKVSSHGVLAKAVLESLHGSQYLHYFLASKKVAFVVLKSEEYSSKKAVHTAVTLQSQEGRSCTLVCRQSRGIKRV